MSITTKFGDSGKTRLCCGDVVSKTHERVKCTGDVDTLVTMLGITKAHLLESQRCPCFIISEIENIQKTLFIIGSEVACSINCVEELKDRIDETKLQSLDERRTFIESQISMPTGFILPGKNVLSANLDMCRVYCRTLERSVLALQEKLLLDNEYMIPFINRLSDYLYLLARNAEGNKYNHVKENNE